MSKQFQNPIEIRKIDTPNTQLHEHLKEQRLDWLWITIMCPSGTTCLSTDCCVSELAL